MNVVDPPPPAVPAHAQAVPALRRLLRAQSLHLYLLLLISVVGASIVSHGSFLSAGNLASIASQLPELGVLTLAMVVALMSGGINLATVTTANFTAFLMATALKWSFVAGLPTPGLILYVLLVGAGGLTCGLLLGALTGGLIAYVGVSSILATLGLMTLLEGATLMASGGTVISRFPEPVLWIGQKTVAGVPAPMLLFGAALALSAYLIGFTGFGVRLVMVGSNLQASEYSGIHTRRVLVQTYAFSGLLSALAGFIMMARFNSVNVSYGQSYLLVSILAAVLGGVDPAGGRGRVLHVFIALLTLQTISSVMNLLGFSNHLTLVIWGGLLIASVAWTRWRGSER